MELTILDAGVLIAVLDADDAHHLAARAALTVIRHRRDRVVVPVSAYAEVLVAPFRRSAEDVARVDAFIDALPATVEAANRDVGRRASELRARHGNRLRLPDALVIATGLVLRADRVVTTDSRWPNVAITIEVIRPEEG